MAFVWGQILHKAKNVGALGLGRGSGVGDKEVASNVEAIVTISSRFCVGHLYGKTQLRGDAYIASQ